MREARRKGKAREESGVRVGEGGNIKQRSSVASRQQSVGARERPHRAHASAIQTPLHSAHEQL